MNLELALEDESLDNLKPRRQAFAPRTRKDYLKVIISITKRPAKDIAILTAHWRFPETFVEVQSECKLKKDEVSKAKYINWFIREFRLKETNLT